MNFKLIFLSFVFFLQFVHAGGGGGFDVGNGSENSELKVTDPDESNSYFENLMLYPPQFLILKNTNKNSIVDAD